MPAKRHWQSVTTTINKRKKMLEDNVHDNMKLNVADDEADDGNGNNEKDAKNKLADNVLDDETKQVSKNVVNILKQCNQVNTRSYSLHRSILVNKDKDEMIKNINVMNPPSNTPSNKTNATATAALQCIDIGNDKEIDIEKEKEGKNCTVKVCMDSDVEIIGEAFVSDMMGVDIQHNVHDETVKPNKKRNQRNRQGN